MLRRGLATLVRAEVVMTGGDTITVTQQHPARGPHCPPRTCPAQPWPGTLGQRRWRPAAHCEGAYTHRGYRLDVKINLPQDGQFVRTLSANRVPKRSETPILYTRRSRPLLGRVFSAFYNGPRPPFENWNLAFLCLNKFFPDKPISISIQSCCACVRISRECVPEVGGKSRGLALFWEGMGSSP